MLHFLRARLHFMEIHPLRVTNDIYCKALYDTYLPFAKSEAWYAGRFLTSYRNDRTLFNNWGGGVWHHNHSINAVTSYPCRPTFFHSQFLRFIFIQMVNIQLFTKDVISSFCPRPKGGGHNARMTLGGV